MTVCAFAFPETLRMSVLYYTIGYSVLYLVYLHMSYQISQNRLATA
jgi:hypothetical protein